MKIRQGFVSNSSSSSFVVSFPKKPKNSAEVWEMMFNSKDGHISIYENEAISYYQVASNVFQSISANKFKRASLKNVANIFDGRYHYYTNSCNVSWDGQIIDKKGGSWIGNLSRYYGSDTNLMNKLRDFIIDRENKERKLSIQGEDIINKSGIIRAPYAYKDGINHDTKTPYTDKEVAAYESYKDAIENYKNTNPEYIAWRKEKDKLWKHKFGVEGKLMNQIAKKDAQNFFDDNKGRFIFIVEYSDNDGGDGSLMEHGDIFRNVPHVQISNH